MTKHYKHGITEIAVAKLVSAGVRDRRRPILISVLEVISELPWQAMVCFGRKGSIVIWGG
jgi:hypothetical protein